MGETKTKIWIVLAISALVAVGAVASLVSQKQPFYKGAFPAVPNEAVKTSVLDASENESSLPDYLIPEVALTEREKAKIFAETHTSATELLNQGANVLKTLSAKLAVSVEEKKKEKIEERKAVQSPCEGRGVPILKDGKIAGCSGDPKPQEIPLPAVQALSVVHASKVKTMESLPLQSCESQGKLTYTGEDQPGILYGMCIDCQTQDFIKNGSRCLN